MAPSAPSAAHPSPPAVAPPPSSGTGPESVAEAAAAMVSLQQPAAAAAARQPQEQVMPAAAAAAASAASGGAPALASEPGFSPGGQGGAPSASSSAPSSAPAAAKKRKISEADEAVLRQLQDVVAGDIELADKDKPVKVSRTGQTSRLVSIRGHASLSLSNNVLMKLCYNLSIGSSRNKSKKELCDMLVAWAVNKTAYESIGRLGMNDNEPQAEAEGTERNRSRMTLNDWFRFINILFHPEMKERFAKLGHQPDKDDLTLGKAAHEDFFEDSSSMHNETGDELVDKMQHKHQVFDMFDIDPSVFTYKSSKDLRAKFKELEKLHLKKFINWHQSGEHAPMEDFFRNDAKTFYYQLYLEDNPGITASCVPALPDSTFMQSTGGPNHRSSEGARKGRKGRGGGGGGGRGGSGGGAESSLSTLAEQSKKRTEIAEKRQEMVRLALAEQAREGYQRELALVNDAMGKLRKERRELKEGGGDEMELEEINDDLRFYFEEKAELKRKIRRLSPSAGTEGGDEGEEKTDTEETG